MGKGGRYLDKTQKGKKKGKGWKIALIVLVVLAVLIGGVAIAANSVLHGMLDKINRAEVIHRDDVSDEDFDYWMTWSPDSADGAEDPVAEPADTQSVPAEETVQATGE